MHDELELLDLDDDGDTTVTFTDDGDVLPVENDPIASLTKTVLDLRNQLGESKAEADYLRGRYTDSVRRTDDVRNKAERYQMVLRGEKDAAERRVAEKDAEMTKTVTEWEKHAAKLKADILQQNDAISEMSLTIGELNTKLARFAALHDRLESLTLAADERARKNAVEILVAQVHRKDWDVEHLKMAGSHSLGKCEAFDAVNTAVCDILAGREDWEL